MADRVLSPRALNRALLARQLLLERSALPIADAVDRAGGLQTQYAPSGYVGLWTRLAGFRRDDLTAALQVRDVVQGTLMRSTIHMVSRREYWLFAMGVRQARRTWALRVGIQKDAAVLEAGAELLRAELAAGPRTVRDLGDAVGGSAGDLGLWVDLCASRPPAPGSGGVPTSSRSPSSGSVRRTSPKGKVAPTW